MLSLLYKKWRDLERFRIIKMNYKILFTSKNNYDLLENWVNRCSNYKTPDIINLDLGSDPDQYQKGCDFCQKNNIEFIKAERTEFQHNIKQVFDYLENNKMGYILYLHQDCFPVNESSFVKINYSIENNNLSKFGCIGFNIYHDIEIKHLKENNLRLMTTSRCILQKGNGYYMRFPKGSRVNYNKFIKNKAFSVENIMWTALLLSSKSFVKNIEIDLNFNFFFSPDDLAYQFLYNNVHNVFIPGIHFIHDQSIKTKYQLPKDSPLGKKEDVVKRYGRVDHAKIWKNKWGFIYDPTKYIQILNNRIIKYFLSRLASKFYSSCETKTRKEYKNAKLKSHLMDDYFNHDPINGPLKYFDLKLQE